MRLQLPDNLILAFGLILCLLLPSPTWALRTPQPDQIPKLAEELTAGLEEETVRQLRETLFQNRIMFGLIGGIVEALQQGKTVVIADPHGSGQDEELGEEVSEFFAALFQILSDLELLQKVHMGVKPTAPQDDLEPFLRDWIANSPAASWSEFIRSGDQYFQRYGVPIGGQFAHLQHWFPAFRVALERGVKFGGYDPRPYLNDLDGLRENFAGSGSDLRNPSLPVAGGITEKLMAKAIISQLAHKGNVIVAGTEHAAKGLHRMGDLLDVEKTSDVVTILFRPGWVSYGEHHQPLVDLLGKTGLSHVVARVDKNSPAAEFPVFKARFAKNWPGSRLDIGPEMSAKLRTFDIIAYYKTPEDLRADLVGYSPFIPALPERPPQVAKVLRGQLKGDVISVAFGAQGEQVTATSLSGFPSSSVSRQGDLVRWRTKNGISLGFDAPGSIKRPANLRILNPTASWAASPRWTKKDKAFIRIHDVHSGKKIADLFHGDEVLEKWKIAFSSDGSLMGSVTNLGR
jgi:hypothetical protein